MPLPTFTPPVEPSPGTAYKRRINLWEADFGDGYSQPTPKGINHICKSVALAWDVLTYEQMCAIIDFFEERGGSQPFYFQPYGETAMGKWTCKDFAESTDDGVWSVTAELIQSYTAAS
jgi:phage-related protein